MSGWKEYAVVPGLIVVVGALLACKKDDKKEESGSTTSGATAGESSTGVPECDEYITKYEKCVSEKVPEVARAQMKQAFQQQRESFKQMGSNPATKAGAASACKQALEAAKGAMGAYGCTF